MNSIRQVVYISQASNTFIESELDALVSVSRCNNKKNGITGAMLYLENSFIQVIEGEGVAIAELLDKLYADTRHHNIRIISDQRVANRSFCNWSMGVIATPEEDRPQVLQEINLAKNTNGKSAELSLVMPVCQTFMMMRRLYDTSSVLQRAKGNLTA